MRRSTALWIALIPVLLQASCALLTPARRPGSRGELVLSMPGAACVQVIGDWNDWGGPAAAGGVPDPSVGAMSSEDGSIWTCPLPSGLEIGWYRYAFLVDGWRWVADPLNPETTMYTDREVSVLRVGN